MNKMNLDLRLERIERLLIANKKVLTFDEACEYSDISRSYMYKLTSQNKIPFSKPNGKIIFFDKDKLEAWLLQNKSKTEGEIEQEALDYLIRK